MQRTTVEDAPVSVTGTDAPAAGFAPSRLASALPFTHGLITKPRQLLRRPATQASTGAVLDQFVVSAVNFATTIAIGRAAGAEALGLYALGFTIVVLLVVALESLIGAPYIVFSNRLSGRAHREYAGSMVLLYGLLAAVATLALAGAAAAMWITGSSSGLGVVILTIAVVSPFLMWRHFVRTFLFAALQMRQAFALDCTVAVFQGLGLGLLIVAGVLTAVTAHAAVGVACALGGGIWIAVSHRRFIMRMANVRHELRRHWEFGRWVLATNVSGAVRGYAMHWLLLLMLNPGATGAYAACFTIVMLSNPLTRGIGNVLAPRAARAFATTRNTGVRRVVTQTAIVLGGMMTTFGILAFALGEELLRLFYGFEYQAYGQTVGVLAVVMGIAALALAVDAGLRAIERPGVNFKASVVSLSVTLVLAAFAIPRLEVLGAALSYLGGSAAGTALRWIIFFRLTKDA